ncbi:response regulator [Noviherbaspirillum pedocola]|uniref:histidine kinase n=1 Tax=Noviherbaspirillum pedocola TaxID=2801341 RepID=A0A934SY14_9BURK|nr:response regulator [Noviherbaspirillum pedocola]MBK4737764.1 response regulator [Noviherbaspirillum pedocola]
MTSESDSDLILNVDDTEAARYAKTRILTRAGFRVIEAANGSDALDMAAAQRPMLVLLDVKLPDINGFEVCRMLKANPDTRHILVLQTSASYIGMGDKVRALEGGADNYLFEPIEPEELVANVRALLRLGRAEREMRATDQRKNEFLAMLAHELRNPLGPIRNAVELLAFMEPNASRIQETARNTILRQTDHMVRLIDDLLDVARISQGKINLRQEEVSLKEVVHAAVESARTLIDRYQHALQVVLPEGDVKLAGDSVRLAQIISNLLTNAAKFTPQKGQLALSAWRDGADVVIRVQDNGIGMSAQDTNSVFELFRQANHLPERARDGLGIGLALVKTLVEMHRGSVRVDSAGPGAGSSFEVRLPAKREAHASQPLVEAPQAEDNARHRILLVDDNVDAAEMLACLLEVQGNEVRKAHDGRSGIDAARRFLPHIVILDIALPDMTGFDVVKAMRDMDETAHALILALSGYGQEADKQQALAAGFNGHLTKPVSFEALEAIVREHFERAS